MKLSRTNILVTICIAFLLAALLAMNIFVPDAFWYSGIQRLIEAFGLIFSVVFLVVLARRPRNAKPAKPGVVAYGWGLIALSTLSFFAFLEIAPHAGYVALVLWFCIFIVGFSLGVGLFLWHLVTTRA